MSNFRVRRKVGPNASTVTTPPPRRLPGVVLSIAHLWHAADDVFGGSGQSSGIVAIVGVVMANAVIITRFFIRRTLPPVIARSS